MAAGVDRVLQGDSWEASAAFYAGEVPSDPGVVAVTATGDDGTVVHSGNASGTGVFARTATIPASAHVDKLTLVWTGTATVTTYAEVVGGFYFDLPDLRSLPDMDDEERYPTARLAASRAWIESVIERRCETSFVQRFGRKRLPARGPLRVDPYATQILSASYGATAIDVATLDLNYGVIRPADGLSRIGDGKTPITVRYSAGCGTSCPPDLAEVALAAARTHLLDQHGESAIPSRVISTSNDFGGVTRYAQPSQQFPTGIPEADAVINDYAARVRVPSVA